MIKKTKKEIKEGLIEFFGSIFWYIVAIGITLFIFGYLNDKLPLLF